MWKVGKCTGQLRTGLEGSESRYSFFNLGARWGGLLTTRPGCYTPEKQFRYSLYRRLWAPGPVSTVAKNLAPPNGSRSPDRRACSEALYGHAACAPKYILLQTCGSACVCVLCAGRTFSLSAGTEEGC
jgi:hypothetical protein